MDNPTLGLGMGNGAGPPDFSVLSTLIVNAYKRMGHGMKLTSADKARLFLLVAVMYVYDTDLLHRAKKSNSMRRNRLNRYRVPQLIGQCWVTQQAGILSQRNAGCVFRHTGL